MKLEIIKEDGYKVYGQGNVINNDFTWGHRHIDEGKFQELSVYEIHQNDIIITMMGTTGQAKVVPQNIKPGIFDSHIIRVRVNKRTFPEFVSMLINDSYYVYNQVKINSKGSIMEGLNSSIVKAIQIALPPPPEQQIIANFLDRKTAQIDTLIEKKQQQIDLLQEQRTALINHAVTKGLNPDVRMKDSGVEWLGEIPSHWEAQKVKRVVDVIDGDRGKEYPNDNDYVNTGIPFLSSKNIIDNKLDLTEVRFISKEKFERLGRGKLAKGDLVITVRGTIGSVGCFLGDEYETAFINAQMMILRPEKELSSKFFYYLARSNYWFTQLDYSAYGAAQQQLSNVVLQNLSIALPPQQEQKAIMDFLDHRMAQHESTVQRIRSEISLLQEYRTALISEAVTGKIDVRTAE